MRIALVTDTYMPQVNGVTTVVRRQVGALKRSGAEVALVAPAYPGAAPPDDTPVLRIRSLPFPPYPAIRLALTFPRRVTRFLDAFRPDLLHVVTEGPLGVLGRNYARRRELPLVTSYHTHFPRYCADYGLPLLEPVVWRWITWFHRPAALVQTPGDGALAALRAHGLGQAVVWGRGVDTEMFHPSRRRLSWRREAGIHPDTVIVLHVGRLAPEKNLELLTVAWTRARTALGDRVLFILAGDGPQTGRLLGRMSWVRHLGFLNRAVLADLYANVDLCVLPSKTETCGLVALEALASGVPVIAANAGGLRESVVHRENGLLVEPDDAEGFAQAIIELSLGAALRESLGEAARRSVLCRDAAAEDHELLRQYGTLLRPPSEKVACPAA